MEKNLLTIDELAEKWKVKKSFLYSRTRETHKNAIPRLKIGKYLRFVEAEVMEWLERQQEK